MKRNVDVIIGGQHGDEGKGKIINEMCGHYDVNVRYQGGANSGHTIYTDSGDKVVFNVIPSGMANKNITGVITQGVVINPYDFMREINRVLPSVEGLFDRLVVSSDCQLTIPTHIIIDHYTEMARSKSGSEIIGSTKRGNTPTYVDKIARRGLRISDITKDDFPERYMQLVNHHIEYLKGSFGAKEEDIFSIKIGDMTLHEYEKEWHISAAMMISLVKQCNTVQFLHRKIFDGSKILLEGAQGCMLDIDYGTYPFVTSSSVTSSAAFAQTGIPVQCVNRVYMVFKPYVTRVGQGFFPTQITAEPYLPTADHIIEKGSEFGSVTGRKRKIGWLDMPQLKYACMINGVTNLILMKMDMLEETPTDILVCDSYSYSYNNHVTEYRGEDMFISANYKIFKAIGSIKEHVSDEAWSLINYIDDYVSDVLTKPVVTIMSKSPTEPSVGIGKTL